MKRNAPALSLLLCTALAAASCATGRPGALGASPASDQSAGDPETRYRNAVARRAAGDSQAYYSELLALAHEAPQTRAGRRARAAVGSGELATTLSVVGILAAIAIPNFVRFTARSKQSEAKVNLRAIWVAQAAHRAETDRFAPTFAELGLSLGESRYVYFMGPAELAGGERAPNKGRLLEAARLMLAAQGWEPAAGPNTLRVIAVADLDDDPSDLDVWEVNDAGEVRMLSDDTR